METQNIVFLFLIVVLALIAFGGEAWLAMGLEKTSGRQGRTVWRPKSLVRRMRGDRSKPALAKKRCAARQSTAARQMGE
jgi:hypothetical protein